MAEQRDERSQREELRTEPRRERQERREPRRQDRWQVEEAPSFRFPRI